MKKVFYLKTCSTCQRILKEFSWEGWKMREIKSKPVTESELVKMYQRTNSYEALFSKRSSQIKAQNIDVESLQEEDFKRLLLDHYTFLKRPVFITESDIFIGNDKETIEKLKAHTSATK